MTETRIEIIVTGDNAEAAMSQLAAQLPPGAEVVTAGDTLPTLPELIASGVAASAGLSAKVDGWFAAVAASGGTQPLAALAYCAIIFVAAYLIERVLTQLALARVKPTTGAADDAASRLSAALKWGGIKLIGLFVFFGLSVLAMNILLGSGTAAFALGSAALSSVLLPRAWMAIMELLTASRDASRRANSLTDPEATRIMRAALLLVIFFAVTAFFRDFVVAVVDAGETGALFAVITRVFDGIAAAVFFVAVQKPVGGLITRAMSKDPLRPTPFVRLLARFWPILYIFLFVLQVAAEANGYLSGSLGEGASALKRSFAAFVITPFIVAALGIWRAHLLETAEHSKRARISGIFSLLEGAITVGAAIMILYAWNIDPFATDLEGAKRILPGLVSAAIVTVIGLAAWRTISGFLSTDTDTGADDGAASDGEGGVGGSRTETVLPILRTALAVLIGTVTVLLALSSLGVQIAPLLAGAGILGLAVGFGAQKIVEDIISGVLYLVEDAFRKGEYIETSQGKGVVEAIMLRSVRLRHHLGAVYTVPFSSMGTIQNHSRDWVTVKLSFEVSPTQDLEKVRKLVKKVGEQLKDDPELEGQFLAPLKSQGAVALVGSNYKIGVKFTSKPGEQFLIRRKALNAIQKAFADNNIQMAAPRVIVDSGESGEAAAAKVAIDAAKPA